MSRARPPAPVFADAMTLAEWLLGHFDRSDSALGRLLAQDAVRLAAEVAVALRRSERADLIEAADERLAAIRVGLRLCPAATLLDDRQVAHGLERADAVGRQLGGWLRSLGPA